MCHSNGTGVAEVVPCKACLVTQLFLNPESKVTCDKSGSNKEDRSDVLLIGTLDTVWISIHVDNMNTHLMSWLYLARRSDRQGAPVLI